MLQRHLAVSDDFRPRRLKGLGAIQRRLASADLLQRLDGLGLDVLRRLAELSADISQRLLASKANLLLRLRQTARWWARLLHRSRRQERGPWSAMCHCAHAHGTRIRGSWRWLQHRCGLDHFSATGLPKRCQPLCGRGSGSTRGSSARSVSRAMLYVHVRVPTCRSVGALSLCFWRWCDRGWDVVGHKLLHILVQRPKLRV
mmetsp:Transcript_43209/g.119491  ORF Transcript_43209/g.119491 Transcript_43209/m.119491 type:complete len:201 (-) Transcript_43209:958-1560(-)